MNEAAPILTPAPRDATLDTVIKLAVMAVGGQGGGVLTGWIESMARAQGWAVQATSVAGVAQRTGATIYYIEMARDGGEGAAPVFSLAPAAGDVDILIAAELMEAGRAVLRGFVTPDRTTLIASNHRALAVSEKTVPGDGIAHAEEVVAAAELAAQRLILFDMEAVAQRAGTVISAALFGALAGSVSLPFARHAYEHAIRASGRGVEASLTAFDAAFAEARGDAPAAAATAEVPAPATPPGAHLGADWVALLGRIDRVPRGARDMVRAGLVKVVGFQDMGYGFEYLDRVARVATLDMGAGDHELTREAAKYVANAMAYDDMIRVADAKTRPDRFARIRDEMGVADGRLLRLIDYTHPRAEEVVSLFPARLGRWVTARPRLMGWIDRRVNRGRRLRSDRILPFLQLYLLAGLRGWRRRTLRHAAEMAHLDGWLEVALEHARCDPAHGVETLRLRRLVKGYADTHARGLSKFDRALAGAQAVAGRKDAADWTRRLREAALQDEEGLALDGALRTIGTFAGAARDQSTSSTE
ncbi:indolepyruvate oxidoreductase subunit beta family protein [Pararhodobacter sp. SW119]|uniref:indolepyruvate oxidoreductase subunit beta family protein n=1 Tax=Pararhodobacter sp. SW119 TaxID=2780075 RepID=UPI001AE0D648|nr:indolepyruvate oxidoreductase subunit beta family protein [Pararhodobacter sp. SW119]